MPIEGIPSSNQTAAFGAAAAAGSTGFDRIAGKDRVKSDNPIDFEPKGPFKDLLIEMVESDGLSEVNEKRERRPGEEDLIYQEQLSRLTEQKLNSIVKKKETGKERRERRRAEVVAKQETENPAPTEEEIAAGLAESPEEYVSSGERLNIIEEDMLKEYIAMTSKRIVGRPADAMEGVNASLGILRDQLFARGLIQDDLVYLDSKAMQLLKESFLRMIKERFLWSSETPVSMIDFILNARSGKTITELLSALEKDSFSLSEQAKMLRNMDVVELSQIAQYLKLDVDKWMSSLNTDKITAERKGMDDIFFHAVELPPVREISGIVDEYRSTRTQLYSEERLNERLRTMWKLRGMRKKLIEHGMTGANIKSIEVQSRRIAWLKTISHLKENHLRRILTASTDDFNKISDAIIKLTSQANKLGYDIPKEGIKWIETGLSKLGFETASYKLQLLQSLQKMAFDAKRENDIIRLQKIVIDLEKKMRQ